MARQIPPLSLDPDGPLPLYHQIAVALRYRIATGRLEPGERLPSLRQAAPAWGVNYHTVRKAYGLLEKMGLVQRRRGAGTRVTASETAGAVPTSDDELHRFLIEMAEEARVRFGLTPGDLSRAVAAVVGAPRSPTGAARATVVECNAHQCRDLASQLSSRFRLEVAEHLLGSRGELPSGPVVGTHFHLLEMRRAWPERVHDMYFAAIHPDPALRERLESYASHDPVRVPLCEREGSLAAAMAEDVQLLLSEEVFEIVPEVARAPREVLSEGPGRPVLVAPRVWNGLDAELRARPELIEVRYRFRDRDLEAIAAELGWESRSPASAASEP